MPRCPAADLVLLEQHHSLDPQRAQLIGERASRDPASDDHYARLIWRRRVAYLSHITPLTFRTHGHRANYDLEDWTCQSGSPACEVDKRAFTAIGSLCQYAFYHLGTKRAVTIALGGPVSRTL